MIRDPEDTDWTKAEHMVLVLGAKKGYKGAIEELARRAGELD